VRLLLVFVIAGCAVSVDDFAERLSDALCDRAEQCGELNQSYANCQTTFRGLAQGWINVADGLNYEYQPDGARQCLRAFRQRECGTTIDFDQVCSEVWR